MTEPITHSSSHLTSSHLISAALCLHSCMFQNLLSFSLLSPLSSLRSPFSSPLVQAPSLHLVRLSQYPLEGIWFLFLEKSITRASLSPFIQRTLSSISITKNLESLAATTKVETKMGMGSSNSIKDSYRSFTKIRSWALYILFPLTLLHLYFYPLHLTPSLPNPSSLNKPVILSSQVLKRGEFNEEEISCDYFNGKWVQDKKGPLYNGTSCSTIKDGQNCLNHGRPDKGYLFWRWRPKQCRLRRFEPSTFLSLLENKHVAFVGDSMARNQLESLLCLVSTASSPDLVYRSGDDNKFRRWHFPSHNLNISIYWSPFLVKGIEKSDTGYDHNKLYLDSVDERWASELGQMDMLVLSVGHWFLHPAVYYEKESVLGCHYCPGLNHTEIGFYDVYRKAFNTTLKAVIDRRGGDGMDVIVTTFSPSHFEGDWDKAGACPKKQPYKEWEKTVEGMDAEMRKIGVEELEGAKAMKKEPEMATGKTAGLRLQALDVTKLALLRPDGHPGPYMYPFPFANGVSERVQNDCVHWCLPGPIDTWNEILLEIIRRWETHSRYGSKMKVGRV